MTNWFINRLSKQLNMQKSRRT
uniref:Uncharacterized protein n=1 Tax=Anguilla anguilla TaxID=7936 RepID=A0A0E9T6Y5_ANGAN